MWSRVGGRTRSLLAAGLRALGPPLGPGYFERLEELLITADVGADPAAVVFDGVQQARRRGLDVVVVDTAGRLHSQRNLLEELAKIGRVTAKALEGAEYESLLVLDALLGLASVQQARTFNEAIPITGLVLAKLDGSAKGGSAITIEAELGVPVKLAGVGEGLQDLAPFDPSAFIRSMVED